MSLAAIRQSAQSIVQAHALYEKALEKNTKEAEKLRVFLIGLSKTLEKQVGELRGDVS